MFRHRRVQLNAAGQVELRLKTPWRDGLSVTWRLFATMGWAGVGLGLRFTITSTAFIVALSHTTVANILLMQAGASLFAAQLSFVLFRDRIGPATPIPMAD